VASVYEISQAFRAALLQRDRTAAARLISVYGVAFERLNVSLSQLTKQIEAARARGEEITEAWLYRQARFRELIDQAGREILALAKYGDGLISDQQQIEIERGLRDSATLMETGAQEAGISASFNRVPKGAVESLVGHLGDGSPLRTVLNRYGAAGAAKIEQELIAGLVAGEGLAKVARRLRDVEELSRAKAMQIARSETLRAYRSASLRNYQANEDLISGWEWVSAKQAGRTCLACISLDGTFFPLDKPMPAHPNCRCVQIPRIKGQPPRQRETAAQWFAKQPDSVKRQSMTDDELEAFNEGKVSLQGFVGRTDSEKWGTSYHQLSLKRALAGEGKFPDNQRPVVEPPEPPEPVEPKPAGIPIDRGLKLPSKGPVANAGRNALAAIARVHGDGELPEIPVERETSVRRFGGYHYYGAPSNKPVKITVRPGAAAHPEMTLAHEIGHFLDHQGAGKGKHASVAADDFAEFREAAKQSRAIQEIERLIKLRKVAVRLGGGEEIEYPVDGKYLRYLTDTKEVWARAYAQYIAHRSADVEMQSQLKQLRQRLGQVYYPSQWDDDDFAPIAEAIDRLMLKLGWRK